MALGAACCDQLKGQKCGSQATIALIFTPNPHIHHQYSYSPPIPIIILISTLIDLASLMMTIRDIKDENILVNLKTGNLAIIDFGSGCHANQDPLREFEGWHICTMCTIEHQYIIDALA